MIIQSIKKHLPHTDSNRFLPSLAMVFGHTRICTAVKDLRIPDARVGVSPTVHPCEVETGREREGAETVAAVWLILQTVVFPLERSRVVIG